MSRYTRKRCNVNVKADVNADVDVNVDADAGAPVGWCARTEAAGEGGATTALNSDMCFSLYRPAGRLPECRYMLGAGTTEGGSWPI
jgi:hypothetical protein